MAGTYNGKVLITQVTPATAKENAGEAPQGQDVNATVKNDTVFFDKLPVTELITSIVGDKDKAEAIVKAIGDVKYKVGYKPALNTEKDSIYLAFDPKPLTLQLPAAVEGQEGQTVTVTISSPDKGSFAYKKNQLKLKLSADKVELAGVAVPVPQTPVSYTHLIEQAIVVFNKLIDKNPYNPAYWVGLAKCQFATKDFDKAIESCDFAIAADEEFGEAHIIKAHSLFHLENIEGAIVEYRKALKYKTLSPEFTYMFIGLAYTQQENWAEANESYSMALRAIEENGNGSSPLLSDIYSNKALCASRQGDSEEAHRLCRLAKERAPQDAEPYLLEGRIYMEEDNFDLARACLLYTSSPGS